MDDLPQLVTLADPLDPCDAGLEEVGPFLDRHLRDPRSCQVWVPDREAFRALAIEGRRGRNDPRLPAGRRQFGASCHALARLEPLAGQQVLAIAVTLLGAHLLTGQSPTEDSHLGARLAWDAPPPGLPPARLAAVRRLRPGPALLPVADEEAVEALRAKLKTAPHDRELRGEVSWLLAWTAEGSWWLLHQAWEAYGALPMPPLPGLGELEADSHRELAWLLGGAPDVGSHLGRTVAELRKREFWHDRFEDLNVRGDLVRREAARRDGRVIAATTWRTRAGRLLIHTNQEARRLRTGARLKTADGRVEAVVEAIRTQDRGAWLLLRVTRGVTTVATLPPGDVIDWCDSVVFRGRPPRVPSGVPTARALAPVPGPSVPATTAGGGSNP